MSKEVNDINAKRGAGRPEVDNQAIFDELMSKPETRSQIVKQVSYLMTQRKALIGKQDQYKDDVKATKEAFGLNGSFITQAVDALIKDTTDKKRKESAQFADFLQILQEEIYGTGSEEDDEWKDDEE